MIIDTRTKDSMIYSLAEYFDITIDKIFRYILYAAGKAQLDRLEFKSDVFEKEILSLFSELKPKDKVEEIYVYHLTRRLNSYIEDKSSDNLKSLLLKDSPISSFLSKYQIRFIEKDGHLVIVFNNEEVLLNDTLESNVCYLKSRLGYNTGREDFCFNGFVLRDQLMKNFYTIRLYNGPEFINALSQYLSIMNMQKDYFDNSKYFCYTYKLPINEVIFDDRSSLSNEKKVDFLLVQIAIRVLNYIKDSNYQNDEGNPIVRLKDDACVHENKLLNIEEITSDMLV